MATHTQTLRRPGFALRIAACIAALALSASGAWAQNLQEVIPVGSNAYRLLDNILLESGKVANSAVRPYTKAQFLVALATVDRGALSSQGGSSYDRLMAMLQPDSIYSENKQFNFDAGVALALESYFKTQPGHAEWYKSYDKRMPLGNVAIGLDFADTLSLGADLTVQKEYYAVDADAPGFANLNVPGKLLWFDINQPQYANASLGSDHFNLTFGRNQLTIGPGSYSKLLVSDNADYLEYLSLRTFWNAFTFNAIVISMDPALAAGQTLAAGEASVKNYFLHRTEVSLFDQRLNIALTEGYMIGGAAPELKLFNPMTVFHDYYEWNHASSIFSLDMNWNPFKYFQLYGQLAFNRIAWYEANVYGANDLPSACGYLAGGEWRMPLGEGYLGAVGEFWYTDPWFYIRESSLTSYVWRRSYISNVTGDGAPMVISRPLGFKYGPDSEAFSFTVGYDWRDQLQLRLESAYAMRGQQSLDAAYTQADMTGVAAIDMKTPTGTPENTLSFVLSGSWFPFDWIQVDASFGVYFIQNLNHQAGVGATDLQGSLGVQFYLGRKPYHRR